MKKILLICVNFLLPCSVVASHAIPSSLNYDELLKSIEIIKSNSPSNLVKNQAVGIEHSLQVVKESERALKEAKNNYIEKLPSTKIASTENSHKANYTTNIAKHEYEEKLEYNTIRKKELSEKVEILLNAVASTNKYDKPSFQCLPDFNKCMSSSTDALACGAAGIICLANTLIQSASALDANPNN